MNQDMGQGIGYPWILESDISLVQMRIDLAQELRAKSGEVSLNSDNDSNLFQRWKALGKSLRHLCRRFL